MKVFQTISDAVRAEDVEVVFALMGDANRGLMVDLAERHGVKLIKFRHEQNAVAAADGYTRFSRLSYDERRALKLLNDSKMLVPLQPNEESVQLR